MMLRRWGEGRGGDITKQFEFMINKVHNVN